MPLASHLSPMIGHYFSRWIPQQPFQPSPPHPPFHPPSMPRQPSSQHPPSPAGFPARLKGPYPPCSPRRRHVGFPWGTSSGRWRQLEWRLDRRGGDTEDSAWCGRWCLPWGCRWINHKWTALQPSERCRHRGRSRPVSCLGAVSKLGQGSSATPLKRNDAHDK